MKKRDKKKLVIKKRRFLKRMRNKMALVFVVSMLMFGVIIVRVVYISIAKGEEYSEQVLGQQSYTDTTLPYARGNIVDRNGNILATNEKTYTLVLEPANIKLSDDNYNDTKAAIIKYFGLTEEEFDDLVENGKPYRAVAKSGITYSEMTEFKNFCSSSEGKNVIGYQFEENYKRIYPNGITACHVIGRASSDNQGLEGIEGTYSSYLNGTTGKTYSYMTSDGTVETETIAAVPGNTVVSTIDLNIQKIIEEQITNYMTETGAETIGVIAMDPDNGEILAMASSNNYDLNSPGDTSALRNSCITIEEEVPVSSTEEEADDEDSTEEVETETVETTFNFNEMSDDEFANTIAGLSDDQKELLLNQLWRNYCVADAYEPGSTFKTFTIAGALEENVVQDGQTFYCDGYEIKGNYTIKCHNYTIGGCGLLTLGQTLEQSCNDSLMQIAELEGAVIFDKYQNLFGFGSKTGIDLPGETSGLKYDADSLNSTELATSSFGQSVSVNMVQMTAAFCSVINGGNYYEPHVVKQILNSEGTVVSENDGQLVRKTISKETSELMKTYLYGVVTDGTGKKAAVDGYTIGGKTGTAEKKGRDKTNYVLSFIGFSPVEDPQIVLYVVVDSPNVESQSTSGAGALLFHDIMEELLPYLNIYQSSDETIVSTGDEDEPLESLIDDGTSEDDNSEESTTEEGATEENTTEEATSEVSHDE